jgi:para-nitrobenzyl esterase
MAIGIVQTKYGKVSGIESADPKYAGITYFNGIPYAAPPVGELRWKPPADPVPWDGVRKCDTYGPRAMQQQMVQGLSFEPYSTDFYYMGYPEMSEDCLYLNIATGAESPDEKRPVFMWFHGGGLASGHSYEIEFDPSELAKKGIIVVTVGQRLNIFGYLALPQLSAEQGGKSGNYGLMDEVKALDWVYENIAQFGGDPDSITVGGQSGGTWKSGALAATPASKGRVKRVINQSALCWLTEYRAISEAEANAQEFLNALGLDPEMPIDELRKVDAKVFYSGKFNPFAGGPRMPSDMVYDGYWVPEMKMADSVDKFAGHCDYLIGGNFGENTMRESFSLGGQAYQTAAEVYARAKELLGDLYDRFDFENLVSITDDTADRVSRRLAIEGLTPYSGIFAGEMVNRYFGDYRAAKFPGTKTYSYIFSHITPTRPEEKGTVRDSERLLAWHSSELWYTFASLRENVPPARPWTEADFRLADIISSYWANFVKKGDPNGEGLPFWPASDAGFGWMDLATEPVAHYGLEDDKDQMLYEYTKRNPKLPRK